MTLSALLDRVMPKTAVRRRGDVLRSIADDVRQDLGISPNAELRFECCVKCGIDTTDFDEVERSCHLKFHELMATYPKSIPSQSHLWTPSIELMPRDSRGIPLYPGRSW